MGIAYFTIPLYLFTPMIFKEGSLPLKIWLPFGNLESCYWFYYLVTIFCAVTLTSISVGFDLLFVGIILNVCLKIDMLVKSLQNLSDITNLSNKHEVPIKFLSKIAQEHQLIFE